MESLGAGGRRRDGAVADATVALRRRALHGRGGVAGRSQSGASLLEVLIAIAVVVPVTLAGATGLLTAVRTSAADEARQELEVALSTATERLKATPYVPCASPDDYGRVVSEPAPGVAAAVLDVQHWQSGRGEFTDRCTRDGGVQRIEVDVTDGERVRSGWIVVRDPSATAGGR